MIYFTCPGCQRIGQASADLAGKMAACPGCGQQLLVPHFVLTAPQAPPEPADGLLRFPCPNCRRQLKVPRAAANTIIHCNQCGWRIDVAAATQQAGPTRPTGQSVLAYLPDIIQEDAAHYYYMKDDRRHGPVTALALRQMAATGQLAPTDLVWKPGFAHWKAASKAKGLFPPKAPPPAPPANSVAPPPKAPPPLPTAPPTSAASPPPLLPTRRPSAIGRTAPPPPLETGTAPALVHRGLSLAEQEDHERALADLDAALRLEPGNAQALAARGLIFAKSKGNYHRGLADLTAAIRFAPGESALYELRAILFREFGNLARAQADEKKAAELRKR